MGLSIYWQQGVQWTLTTLSLRKGNLKALEMLIFSCKNVRHRYIFEYLFFCSLQVRPIFHIYFLVLLVSGNLLDRVSSLSLLSKQKSKFRVSYPMQLHLLDRSSKHTEMSGTKKENPDISEKANCLFKTLKNRPLSPNKFFRTSNLMIIEPSE